MSVHALAGRGSLAVRRASWPMLAAGGAAVGSAIVWWTAPAGALGLVALACFAALVAAFVRVPHAAAAGTVVFLCLQPALKFFVDPAFGPAKDVLVVAAVAGTLAGAVGRREWRHRELDAWLVGGVVLFCLLYVVNPAGGHDAPWFHGSRLVLESFALLLVGYLLPDPRRTWRWVVGALIACCVLNVAVGLAQQLLGTVRLVEDLGYVYGSQVRETVTGRLQSFGTLEEPFSYAQLVLLGLVVAATGVRSRRALWILVPLLVIGVAASLVRTAVFVLAAVGCVALARSGRATSALALSAAIVLSGVLYLATVPQTFSAANRSSVEFVLTLNGRTEIWGALIGPPTAWIGGLGVGAVGAGASRSERGSSLGDGGPQPAATPDTIATFRRYTIDSSYFATVADVGLVGLALLLAILGRLGAAGLSAAARGSPAAWTLVGVLAVLVLDGVTRTSLTAFPVGYIALLVVGASAAAAAADADRPARRAANAPVP